MIQNEKWTKELQKKKKVRNQSQRFVIIELKSDLPWVLQHRGRDGAGDEPDSPNAQHRRNTISTDSITFITNKLQYIHTQQLTSHPAGGSTQTELSNEGFYKWFMPLHVKHISALTASMKREGCSYPHGKGFLTAREGAVMRQQLQVDFADVVLQVEGGGEVRLAAISRTQQHRFMQSVSALVSPQIVTFHKHLLTHGAGVWGWTQTHHMYLHWSAEKIYTLNHHLKLYHLGARARDSPGCVAACFCNLAHVCSTTGHCRWGQQ